MNGPHPLPRDLLHSVEPHGSVIPESNRSILNNYQWGHGYLHIDINFEIFIAVWIDVLWAVVL
jgi:hypothetical protein